MYNNKIKTSLYLRKAVNNTMREITILSMPNPLQRPLRRVVELSVLDDLDIGWPCRVNKVASSSKALYSKS